jgi:hypothetical protein
MAQGTEVLTNSLGCDHWSKYFVPCVVRSRVAKHRIHIAYAADKGAGEYCTGCGQLISPIE